MKLLNYFKEHWLALLIFGLLSGCAYFVIILGVFLIPFLGASNHMLIVWYLSPAIICGAALVIVKSAKNAIEAEKPESIIALTAIHICVVLIGIVFTIALIKHAI